MPTPIRINRNRVNTARYVEKKTKSGYSGKLKKNRTGAHAHESNQSIATPDSLNPVAPGKRPRLETYAKEDDPDVKMEQVEGQFEPFDAWTDADAYREELVSRHTGKSSQGKTSHEVMEMWKSTKVLPYLDRILQAEDRKASACERCHSHEGLWRCLECMPNPVLCSDCCRSTHHHHPLHRIERWNGRHWRPAWLWHVGTVLCLGHDGSPCPKYDAPLDSLQSRLISVNNIDDLEADNTYGAEPKSTSSLGLGRMVVVVHINGFHHVPVFPCWCKSPQTDDLDFLDAGLYPASLQNVSTVFTFDLLNKFHLLKVHSHMSTEHFAALLRRFTNFSFPDKSLDRRRELSRVWFQWNHLMELKKNGFAHDRRGDRPGPGDLALFCAACPQPSINLDSTWKKDANEWLYRRYLVVDGNFVLDHLASGGKGDSVALASGAAFSAEPKRYAKHLKASVEQSETSTCAELRAVAQKNKLKKGYDATGVVAVACARHGCFAPGSVVDLQKGERQMNVDYAVCEALKRTNAGETSGIRLAYDINCQYSINLAARVKNSPYLSLPPGKIIEYVIGLFHVHGHKEECLARFAPTFLPGSGVTSGEIIESLWSTLNGAAPITRNMTPSNRHAFLDACIQDSNLRKIQGLVDYLIRQRDVARTEKAAAEEFFFLLNKVTEAEDSETWLKQMDAANAGRGGHNTSMDGYNFRIPQVEPKKAVQVRLMDEEKRKQSKGAKNKSQLGSANLGSANWVADGIEIQESQLSSCTPFIFQNRLTPLISRITLRGLYRKGQGSSLSDSVDLARKSEALAKRVLKFLKEGKRLFPADDLDLQEGAQWDRDEVEVCVCEEACSCADMEQLPMGRVVFDTTTDELAPLPLPSSFDSLPEGWEETAEREVSMRVAQAEEALEGLRAEIAHKSCLYRAKRQLAGGGRGVTRSYDEINAVEEKMRSYVKVYESARWALSRLGVSRKFVRFRPLTRADTKAVTAVFDPNKPGERNTQLSWIWTMNVNSGASQSSEYLAELRRVNWIRARSRMDRWSEEVLLLDSEMKWYVNFMSHERERVERWANLDLGSGHRAFSFRHADMWRRLGLEGESRFCGQGKPSTDKARGVTKIEKDEDVEMAVDKVLASDIDSEYNPNEPFDSTSQDAMPVFSPQDIVSVRQLDATSFQSLLNYSGSRCLVSATSLSLGMSMMEPRSSEAMIQAVANEIGVGNCLLGLGIMIHGNRVHAPPSLRALTPLMVHGQLSDFGRLKGVVSQKIQGPDDLLPFYAGNWWTNFSPTNTPYPQEVQDIIRLWKQQYPSLPPPMSLPPQVQLNISGLSRVELFEAYAVGEDCSRMLDKDIERCLDHIRGIASNVKAGRILRDRLLGLEREAIASEAAAAVAQAQAHGRDE